jgi:hypothetical protein
LISVLSQIAALGRLDSMRQNITGIPERSAIRNTFWRKWLFLGAEPMVFDADAIAFGSRFCVRQQRCKIIHRCRCLRSDGRLQTSFFCLANSATVGSTTGWLTVRIASRLLAILSDPQLNSRLLFNSSLTFYDRLIVTVFSSV